METNNNLGALLPINENNGQRAVNARDLHSFLESKQDFSTWMKNRIEQYGFVENQDYQVFHKIMENPKGGRPLDEYALSIDMAKELSMVERSERGKQARRYFIACEDKLKEVAAKGYVTTSTAKPKQVNASKKRVEAIFTWVEGLSTMFNLSNAAKFKVLEKEAELLSLPMPDGVRSEGAVERVGKLLKEHNVMNGDKPMRSKDFNDILVEKGYMRTLERTKSDGSIEKYRNLVGRGLIFGINDWNKYSHSPKTEPYFFIDKFPELLKELGLKNNNL